jgi:hypothetical protein
MSQFVITDLSFFESELPKSEEILGGAIPDLSALFDFIPFLSRGNSTPSSPSSGSTYSVQGTSSGNASYEGEEGQTSVSQKTRYS